MHDLLFVFAKMPKTLRHCHRMCEFERRVIDFRWKSNIQCAIYKFLFCETNHKFTCNCDFLFFVTIVGTSWFYSFHSHYHSSNLFSLTLRCRQGTISSRLSSLEPFLSLVVNHKSLSKRFWDMLRIATSHNFIVMDNKELKLFFICPVFFNSESNAVVLLNRCKIILVYDRRNAYFYVKAQTPLGLNVLYFLHSFHFFFFLPFDPSENISFGSVVFLDFHCALHFSLVCCPFNSHVCTIILIWRFQIIKPPSFSSVFNESVMVGCFPSTFSPFRLYFCSHFQRYCVC